MKSNIDWGELTVNWGIDVGEELAKIVAKELACQEYKDLLEEVKLFDKIDFENFYDEQDV